VQGYGAVFLLRDCLDALATEFLSRYAATMRELADTDRVAVLVWPPPVDGSAPVRPSPLYSPADPSAPLEAWPSADGGPGPLASPERPSLGADIALVLWRLLRAPSPAELGPEAGPPARAPAQVPVAAGGRPPASLRAATVSCRQLAEQRRGRLDAEALANRIDLDQPDPGSPTWRSADILAAALERGLTGAGPSERGAALGLHQAGLGVLLLVDVDVPPSAAARHGGDDSRPDAAWNGRVTAAEADLLELLMTYGPTLKGLQDDEQVAIEVRLTCTAAPGATRGPQVTRLLAQVGWRALRDLAAGRTEPGTFAREVRWARY